MFRSSDFSHHGLHHKSVTHMGMNEAWHTSFQRGLASLRKDGKTHSRQITSRTVLSPVSRGRSRAHPMEMLAHISGRSLDLSKLRLPLPKLTTPPTTSNSNQPSYSVQPTTIPKQFNNHPTQLKTKTKPNSQTMASNTLTDNDRKLLAAAWQCFETQPKVRNSLPLTTQPNPTRKPPLHINPRTKTHH